jgi:chromate transporter
LWPNASECLFGLLVGLPLRAKFGSPRFLVWVNAFYGAGSLVFRGDHAVLPLLQVTAVRKNWMSNEIFRAG